MYRCIVLCIFLYAVQLGSAESLNKILGIVGRISITQIDYDIAKEKYNKIEKFIPDQLIQKGKSLKTKVIDYLIINAIVDMTAEEETIQVNEARLEAELKRRMKVMGIDNRKEFETVISQQTKLPFDIWLSELPHQIKKSQLMQIRISTQLPSEKEIRDWYRKNKKKVGFELKYREIAVVPRNSSIQEEKRVYDEISEIYRAVGRDPKAFNLVADGPRNRSNLRGGRMGWIPAFELFNKSRIIASLAASIGIGSISRVFRDETKRYCIIKLEGRRPTPLSSVRRGIQNLLYRQKEDSSFAAWIEQRKKEIPITIFDKEYLAENKLQVPDEDFKFKDTDEDK
ncbi:MAG: putative peptidyl-prolyl cis-trans isomerase [Spirochaetota bacterium]